MDDRSGPVRPQAAGIGWQAPVDLALLWQRIEERMGVCPSFFRLARHEPPIAAALFGMAEFAYLDSPIPAPLKETLFTYLSRFCPIPYCMARHCAFLLGRGTIAGDANAQALDVDHVMRLLEEPLPTHDALAEILATLEQEAPMDEWPAWDSEPGRRLRLASAQVFQRTHLASRWIHALERALGCPRYQQLALLLGFVRLAHFWTEVHPALETEADVHQLLEEHEELSAVMSTVARNSRDTESEERLLIAIEELRARAESDQKVRQLASSLPAYVAYVDAHQRYTFVNETYAHGFMLATHEIVGRSVREVLGADAYASIRSHLELALRGERVRFEGRLRIPSDGERFLEVTYVPDRRPDGSVAGCFVSAIDLTERKRAEERLRRSDRRKDEFLATLGHELRSPLAAIRHASELLGQFAAHEPQLGRIHGVLERQATHMTRLVEGLLEVSRITLGKVTLARENVDLRSLLESVAHDRRAQLAAASVSLQQTVGAEPVVVFGDPVRLTQVIDNLVGNAINFTAHDGTISLLLRAQGEIAELTVRDSGAGINPERLEAIFEPFEQDTPGLARAAGGLGLGLSLVKALVELHQGSIVARSDGPGTGAEFVVRLPLAPTAEGREYPSSPTAAIVPPQRILVVEDNCDAAEMLRDLLAIRGHDVAVADSVPRAIDRLREHPFDVVICDIGLPGVSGHALARHVRADPGLRAMHLIALTGFGQAEDRDRTREAGFDDHLVKPVDLETLEDVLRRLPAH